MKTDSSQLETERRLHVFASEKEWIDFVVADFVTSAELTLKKHNRFDVLLCGGNTPAPIYAALALQSLPWGNIFWWMGDERFVGISDVQRNEAMIRNQFRDVWNLMGPNYVGWDTQSTLAMAAKKMNNNLESVFTNSRGPDFCFLGLGDDGHTASLFPQSAILHESKSLAAATPETHNGTQRLSVTFPLLNRSNKACFVARGPSKKTVVERLSLGDTALVASQVHARHVSICWYANS